MDDLISRQAAIDALGGNEPVGDPSKMDDDDVVKMWERIRIINIINKLPSAQPEQSIAQERYEDLCEYFKDCSDQGRSILTDRKEFKSWLDRMKWHVIECDKLGRELEKLKSAQPTIEPERTGHWVEFPNHNAYVCSECGRMIETTDGKNNVYKHYPYCHCGARMEGEEHD